MLSVHRRQLQLRPGPTSFTEVDAIESDGPNRRKEFALLAFGSLLTDNTHNPDLGAINPVTGLKRRNLHLLV